MSFRPFFFVCASAVVLFATTISEAQTAYGVNSAGILFHFELANPSNVTEVGNVGFVPAGIDFRPGTNILYAVQVGPNTTQVYTIDVNTATPTAVGAGFPSSGVGYDLTGNQTFGFDFNPTTLQADNSMRMRFVATGGSNLRLHSATGGIAAVDGPLQFANGNSPFVDAVAYINNHPTMGGATTLYDLDSRNDALLIQNPPNAGTVTLVGSMGVGVDALSNIGFDIYTVPGDADPGIGGDFAYAVLRRPDAPLGGPLGAYLLYNVDLATGAISNGALVGPAATPYNFDGGFSIIPEPAGWTTLALALLAYSAKRCRRIS